jgi:hypothetical protein
VNEAARWSEAIREVEVLEPWLTESHSDEHYWDDVAERVVEILRAGGASPRDALAAVLTATFDAPLEADNGFYRDRLSDRLDLIVRRATSA